MNSDYGNRENVERVDRSEDRLGHQNLSDNDRTGLGDQQKVLGDDGLGQPGGLHHQTDRRSGGIGGDQFGQDLTDRSNDDRDRNLASGGVGQQADYGMAGRGGQDDLSYGGLGDAGPHGIHGAPPHAGGGASGKASMGDKVKGTLQQVKGKLSGDPATQLEGQQRKQGGGGLGGKNIGSGGAI